MLVSSNIASEKKRDTVLYIIPDIRVFILFAYYGYVNALTEARGWLELDVIPTEPMVLSNFFFFNGAFLWHKVITQNP